MQLETSLKDTRTKNTNMKKHINNKNKQWYDIYDDYTKNKKKLIFEIIIKTKQKIQLL